MWSATRNLCSFVFAAEPATCRARFGEACGQHALPATTASGFRFVDLLAPNGFRETFRKTWDDIEARRGTRLRAPRRASM